LIGNKYDLYCPNCGIKYLKKMNQREYENFLEQEKEETIFTGGTLWE